MGPLCCLSLMINNAMKAQAHHQACSEITPERRDCLLVGGGSATVTHLGRRCRDLGVTLLVTDRGEGLGSLPGLLWPIGDVGVTYYSLGEGGSWAPLLRWVVELHFYSDVKVKQLLSRSFHLARLPLSPSFVYRTQALIIYLFVGALWHLQISASSAPSLEYMRQRESLGNSPSCLSLSSRVPRSSTSSSPFKVSLTFALYIMLRIFVFSLVEKIEKCVYCLFPEASKRYYFKNFWEKKIIVDYMQ